ncbi:MAG: type I phosphomannose isomerase catalytic subunit [Gaiellales bacterium]
MTVDPYPLVLVPILKEKVWGGRSLAEYGKPLPEGRRIGESWELADLARTQKSGGGGGEARSRIANGPLSGSTLHDAVQMWGPELLGADSAAVEFPLLVKYLDAHEHLSVQVHPTAPYAAAHADALVKFESWFVLDAVPGAVLFAGLADGVSPNDVVTAAQDGTVVKLLRRVPAIPGECHRLPSGTVHALGAGVVAAEIQMPSDTTFRIYDWHEEYGRTGRPLHLEAALESMRVGAAPPPRRLEHGAGAGLLVATEHFWVWQLRPERGGVTESAGGACWRVLMVIDGSLEARAGGGTTGTIALARGDTALVPACLAGDLHLTATPSASVLYVGAGRQPAAAPPDRAG